MKKAVNKAALEQLYKTKGAEEPEAETNLDANEEAVETPEASTEVTETPETSGTPEMETKVAGLEAKIIDLEAKITELEAAAEEVSREAEAKDVLITEMQGVLAGQLELRRAALDLAEVDTKEMDAATVLKEFKAADKLFMKSLPSGEVTPEATTAKPEEEKVFKTITDRAAAEALGFE